MKRTMAFVLCLLLWGLTAGAEVRIARAAVQSVQFDVRDTVALRSGEMVLIVPCALIDEATVAGAGKVEGVQSTVGEQMKLRLKSGQTLSGVGMELPSVEDAPGFRTFKFNDKYNDVLFADAEGVVDGNEVRVDVTACIGKTLCPSFSLTSDEGCVYLNGERQTSHGNRQRFDKALRYVITRPGHRIVREDGTTEPWGREVTVRVDFAVDRATSVPRIDINLNGGKAASKITKEAYLAATVTIDGGGVFPDMAETAVQIRGRGNSSWEQYDKKPYRLKFASKQKPLGMRGGKSWCLLAQARTGTLLTNPIALRIASMTGTRGANHVVPVELYVSGEYRGSYILTENPGFANNSINLKDESDAYMIELDHYPDDEWLTQDDTYDLTVNIKEPSSSTLDAIEDWDSYRRSIVDTFNAYTAAIRAGRAAEYEAMMDIDSWARFMLVNDVTRNTEIGQPRSVKIYRERRTDPSDKYIWGPVWDFDWAFGLPEDIYKENAEDDLYKTLGFNYAVTMSGFNPGTFFYDLLNNSEALKAARYATWTEFMARRCELLDYIDDYQRYAQASFEHDRSLWKKEGVDLAANAKAWLVKRSDWVYRNMPAYPLPATVYEPGDVNGDGMVTMADACLLVNKLLGRAVGEFFNAGCADMNGDGRLTIGDLQRIIKMINDK